MVSHDRHLLATVTDSFLLVHGGSVREFDGDLDEYARWLARGDAATATAKPAAQKPAAPKQSAAKSAVAGPKERKNLSPLRSRLARCEKRMNELATAATELDSQLADPALYETSQRARQMDLNAQRARIAQETEDIEAEWLELSEQIEQVGGE
jgi:ATP-binding cassette subfamily F protein 3